MSDSGSSIGETRMLERRISNNRADLNGDQQMNHFLAWFNTWSDLQKSDFVNVLANKMSKSNHVNGLANEFKNLNCQANENGRPASLFACQLKLFNDWFSGWSDDQKNYLTIRLKDIDSAFYDKYEDRVQNPQSEGPKDYFEPGIPPELIRIPNGTHKKDEEESNENCATITNGQDAAEDHSDDSLKKSDDPNQLTPISED